MKKDSSDITQGTLTPTYGRDYKGKTSCIEDFRNGLDFTLNNHGTRWDRKPCSIRDCNPGDLIKLRYNKLTKVAFYTVVAGDLPSTDAGPSKARLDATLCTCQACIDDRAGIQHNVLCFQKRNR